MLPGLTLALKAPVRLLEEAGKPVGLEEPGIKRLRLPVTGQAQEGFLRALARGGRSEEELCGDTGADRGSLELRYLLALLEKEGWIAYALVQGDRVLATLEPLTRAFRLQPAGEGAWRLSRFAWIRRLEGAAVLESPLGFGRILLREPEMVERVGRLCRPQTLEGPSSFLGLAPPLGQAFLALLASAGAVAPCSAEGHLAEDQNPALRQWEFHDLLFHSRSRPGRHAGPAGGTFRFLGDIPPLPALKPPLPDAGIPLPEPSLPPRNPTFFTVLEARRSLRVPGPNPITLSQVATFLHWVARVRKVVPPDPTAGSVYETASGPCPGGGGLHELELYLSVSRCAGLEPGFYRYAPGNHVLERWPSGNAESSRLLLQAREAMGAEAAPDILFTLAARIQRVTWKYQTLAYALILKNTGVLLQQMYLVATALGLAPCAIGTGDTQVFAQASGLDFLQETSVGEFALSGAQIE